MNVSDEERLAALRASRNWERAERKRLERELEEALAEIKRLTTPKSAEQLWEESFDDPMDL